MYEKLNEMVESAVYGIKNWDKDVARIVIIDEEDVDSMEEIYRKRHIERLTKGICTVSNLDYYVDILSNLERILSSRDLISLGGRSQVTTICFFS